MSELMERGGTADARLESLPRHILYGISSHLDRPSAISFAQTCQALQSIGENGVWQDLNISLQRSYLSKPLPHGWPQPLGGDRLYRIRQLYNWDDTIGSDERMVLQPQAIADFLGELINHLKEHPGRIRAVRSISYDIDRLLSIEFKTLLELVAPSLTSLELLPPDFPFGTLPNDAFFTIEKLFPALDTPLFALRHLQLTLNDQWENRIRAVLPCAPHLHSLRLTTSVQYSGGWGEKPIFPLADKRGGWPIMQSLRRLEVDEMSLGFVPMLVALVSGAPLLRHVGLRDPAFQWSPEKGDELLHHLGGLPDLSYLAVTSRSVEEIRRLGTFNSLKSLSMEDEHGSNHLPQIEGSCMGGALLYAECSRAGTIPPLPKVERLFAYTSLQSDNLFAWCWGGEWKSLPEPVCHISSDVVAQLDQAGSLKMIQFPGLPYKEQLDDEWAYWGSTRAFQNHDRGVLIRSYRREDRTVKHNDNEEDVNECEGDSAASRRRQDTLYHCRSYSAHHSRVENSRVYRCEHVWEEFTNYRGECVPADVLCKVYGAAGRSSAWTAPGRDLSLPEEAWEVLKRWAADCTSG